MLHGVRSRDFYKRHIMYVPKFTYDIIDRHVYGKKLRGSQV